MQWVLIMVINAYIETVEFNSEEDCLNAKAQFEEITFSAKGTCVLKTI